MFKDIFMIFCIKKYNKKFIINIYNRLVLYIEHIKVFLCDFNNNSQLTLINITDFLYWQ